MGYQRNPAAHVIDYAIGAPVVHLATDADVAAIAREQDPFGIAHACHNPGGHVPISLGDHIVCFHCSRIFTP